MSCLSRTASLAITSAALFAINLLAYSPIYAQAGGAQSVNIVTVDGVKLKGSFYEGTKKNSPTVIMLHPVGEGKSSKGADWKNLADTLAKAGYSVMMFDFRGHGESTEISDDATFFAVPINRTEVKTKVKTEIDVKDYINSSIYLPVLVNDIAAVKAFLDRKHDGGSCNTSNTIVIGAENGGVLGAIWINSEWHRYKYTPPTMMGKLPVADKRAEGNDIIAGVFLSMTSNLSPKKTVSVTSVLKIPCKDKGMAATFFYGSKDTKAKDAAKLLESRLKDKEGGKDKESKKHRFIGAVELDTTLSGVKLLQKDFGTDKAIVEYLDNVVAERSNEYIERDYQNAVYIWRVPGVAQPVPAKNIKGEKTLRFDNYSKFAQ